MKVTLHTDEITLSVNGREMTFSEKELTSILEGHFESKESKVKQDATELAQVPTEGEWFRVDPLAIDQNLFKEKRKDLKQEKTRQYILEAFEEMKKYSRYARPFKTMMPEKTWHENNVSGLKKLAESLGENNADWVEQALEWGQRIANGESWKDICNKKDTANWNRLVLWKDGDVRFVGGSSVVGDQVPASHVGDVVYRGNSFFNYVVPLVVLYE